MNLVGLLDSTARKHPDRDCLRCQGKGYTFGDILKTAERAAGLFQGWGIQKGDTVAIMSLNTSGFVIAFYGALKAGGVVVPVNHKLAAPEVDYILQHSEAKLFLFDGALAEVARKPPGGIARFASIDSAAEGFDHMEALLETDPPFIPVPISDDDIAEILYTSGTTGKPKGCLHTHRGVIMSVRDCEMDAAEAEAADGIIYE